MGLEKFKLKVLPRAKEEINEISEYYNSRQKGLGKMFYAEFIEYTSTLKTFPFFEEKYNIIRELPLRKFPYTIHFSTDEFNNIVYIQAITCDYQNPESKRIKF